MKKLLLSISIGLMLLLNSFAFGQTVSEKKSYDCIKEKYGDKGSVIDFDTRKSYLIRNKDNVRLFFLEDKSFFHIKKGQGWKTEGQYSCSENTYEIKDKKGNLYDYIDDFLGIKKKEVVASNNIMEIVFYILWLIIWIPVSLYGIFLFAFGLFDTIKEKTYKDNWFIFPTLIITVLLAIVGTFDPLSLPVVIFKLILWIVSIIIIYSIISFINDSIKEENYFSLFAIIPILLIIALVSHITIGATYFSETIFSILGIIISTGFVIGIPLAIISLIWEGIKYIIKAMIKVVKQLSNEVDEELKEKKGE